jgi:hypothetical protein
MTNQVAKMWTRNEILKVLDEIQAQTDELKRMLEEPTFSGKTPAPIRKDLTRLQDHLQKSLKKIRTWAITASERARKLSNELNIERPMVRQVDIVVPVPPKKRVKKEIKKSVKKPVKKSVKQPIKKAKTQPKKPVKKVVKKTLK